DNPWPYGVNWGRAMEVAVRAVNWLWAAAFLAEAPAFTATAKTRFLKAMLQHGRHILDNLEYADNNGNHYLSNGAGLLFLGVPVPPHVMQRLSKMFDFMLAYTRPDGTFPQIGDNDDGRLANLDDEPVGSHQRHLAVGGALLERPELLAAAGDAIETAVWLCGPGVLGQARQVTEVGSTPFAGGGFYVMRAPDIAMTIDA